MLYSVGVGGASLKLAEFFHLKVNEKALIRGALLHDYFLYDWHIKRKGHHFHGFTHPATALRNAEKPGLYALLTSIVQLRKPSHQR